jgi:hypothetical protein
VLDVFVKQVALLRVRQLRACLAVGVQLLVEQVQGAADVHSQIFWAADESEQSLQHLDVSFIIHCIQGLEVKVREGFINGKVEAEDITLDKLLGCYYIVNVELIFTYYLGFFNYLLYQAVMFFTRALPLRHAVSQQNQWHKSLIID